MEREKGKKKDKAQQLFDDYVDEKTTDDKSRIDGCWVVSIRESRNNLLARPV